LEPLTLFAASENSECTKGDRAMWNEIWHEHIELLAKLEGKK
jgi:hypothetical protein